MKSPQKPSTVPTQNDRVTLRLTRAKRLMLEAAAAERGVRISTLVRAAIDRSLTAQAAP
jgi:uncharacterized protein (DUF1778 family)